MKTQRTISSLAIALSMALFLSPRSSVVAEEAGPGFLNVGSTYRIKAVGIDAPINVKILSPAGGQWYRVEAYVLQSGGGWRLLYEGWLNFANVVSITESKDLEKNEPAKK